MSSMANDTVSTTASGVRLGLPLAIGAAFAFGMSGGWARGLMDAGWTPGAAVTARISVAALVLLIPTILSLRGRWGLLRRNIGLIAAYGLLAVAATQFFYFQAVAVMDVGIALLIEYTAPIAVILWLWLRRGERPSRRSILGAVIAFVGLVLMLDIVTGAEVNAHAASCGPSAPWSAPRRTSCSRPRPTRGCRRSRSPGAACCSEHSV